MQMSYLELYRRLLCENFIFAMLKWSGKKTVSTNCVKMINFQFPLKIPKKIVEIIDWAANFSVLFSQTRVNIKKCVEMQQLHTPISFSWQVYANMYSVHTVVYSLLYKRREKEKGEQNKWKRWKKSTHKQNTHQMAQLYVN